MNVLNFQRDRALTWLEQRLKEDSKPSDVDAALDSLIRRAANLPIGPLYGFVQLQKGILLDRIPFWHQLDNYRGPHRTCFSSTCAMLIEAAKPSILTGDDQYVKRVFSFGDTTDANAQIRAIESYGLKASYRQNMDFADLDKSLSEGRPIGIGILHRGPANNPHGGHWLAIVGKTNDGEAYICNDPYGSIGNGYTGPVEQGHHVQYSKKMLRNRWLVEGSNSGWGMIVTS